VLVVINSLLCFVNGIAANYCILVIVALFFVITDAQCSSCNSQILIDSVSAHISSLNGRCVHNCALLWQLSALPQAWVLMPFLGIWTHVWYRVASATPDLRLPS